MATVVNVNHASYGAVGNGVADDTAPLNAAITTVNASSGPTVLYLPGPAYKITSGLLPITRRRVKVVGGGAGDTCLIPIGAIVALSVDPTAGSMIEPIEVSNIRIIGDATFGGVGVYLGPNSSSVTLRNVSIRNCFTGLEMKGTQFSVFDSVTIQSCTIGVRLYQDATVGGGNDNTFQDTNIQSCQVGFMAYQTTIHPMGGNSFNNTAFHTNTLCAVYLENCQGSLFSGAAHEANGEGGDATLLLFGRTLKRSTWHFVGSWARADAWFGVSTEDDSVILEDHSTLVIGSGSSSIFTPSVDSTSRLLFTDQAVLNGNIHGVAQWPSMESESGAQILGEPLLTPSRMPNSVPNPCTLGLYGATGGSSVGFDDDATWTRIPYVQFAGSAGSTSTNRGLFDTKGSAYANATGTFIACSLLIRASVATTIGVDAWQSSSFGTHTLAANKVYRLVIVGYMTATPRSQAVTFYPTDTAGAKLNLWNAHAFVASDPAILSSFVHYGWFNDLSLVRGRETGGLEFGANADTNLYRASANKLKTDDNLHTAGELLTETGFVYLHGSGDTEIHRAGAGLVKTDGKLLAATGVGVGNSAAATTLGTVTKKMQVFDASGASLGYVPIYDAIT